MANDIKILERTRISHERSRLWNPNVHIDVKKEGNVYKATVPGHEAKWSAEDIDEMRAVELVKQKVFDDYRQGNLRDMNKDFV